MQLKAHKDDACSSMWSLGSIKQLEVFPSVTDSHPVEDEELSGLFLGFYSLIVNSFIFRHFLRSVNLCPVSFIISKTYILSGSDDLFCGGAKILQTSNFDK